MVVKITRNKGENMTDQRIYPFMVNGQFWKRMAVDVKCLDKGEIVIYVATKIPIVALKSDKIENKLCQSKMIVFKLVEAAQNYGKYIYKWFQCFYVIDEDLYLTENNELYLKD